jgi:hypothetical protein
VSMLQWGDRQWWLPHIAHGLSVLVLFFPFLYPFLCGGAELGFELRFLNLSWLSRCPQLFLL